MSVRFAMPYFEELTRRFGLEACDDFLASWGTSLAEIGEDETRWVSVAFMSSLCLELYRQTGSDEIIVAGGRLGLRPRYIGALYPVLRVFGSPRMAYRSLPKLSSTVNKVNQVEVERVGRGEAWVTYHHGEKRENTKHVCTARKSQLSAIPNTWGLPDAQLEEVECIHDGGRYCRYHLKWHQRISSIGSLIGLALGFFLAFLFADFTSWSAWLLVAFGLSLGLVVDLTRKNHETRRFAAEQQQGLMSLLRASEQSFQELIDEKERRSEAEDHADDLAGQLLQSQKLEVIGRFAGGIAHDFNNLVAIIQSYAELVEGGIRQGDPLREDVKQILDASARASNLTRQLLAFSRKQLLRPKPLDLNEVVSGVLNMLQRLMGVDIEVQTQLGQDLSLINADPGQLEQVLLNLAVNARDAMPEGGRFTIETLEVQCDEDECLARPEAQPGSYLLLRVSDTGAGMPQETLSKVFEPFFTTKEQGRGTGLGLSTVYGIIRQSGGIIEVKSEPGAGAVFEIYLPTVEGELSLSKEEPKPLDLHGRETILLVDDEEAVRAATRRILRAAGYQVLEAADGEEATRIYQQNQEKTDLLLTDVIMPKMGGVALRDALIEQTPTLPVLFMSGYSDGALSHHGALKAQTHFIAKPFKGTKLLELVRKALEGE